MAPTGDGIFSGGAVINNGVPTLIYHGVPDGTCIATSEDDDLIHWKKCPPNPVIPVPRADQKVEYGFMIRVRGSVAHVVCLDRLGTKLRPA